MEDLRFIHCSLNLPQASKLVGMTIHLSGSSAVLAEDYFSLFAPARLLFTVTQGDLGDAARMLQHPGSFLLIIAGAALLFAAGTAIFERRDLPLKGD